MVKPQRRLVTPKEYVVGVDMPQERYLDAVQKLGDWFAEYRDTPEPVALARRYLDACFKGVKPKDGSPWFEMANSTLAARVRSACRFDIDLMQPIRTGSEKGKVKRQKEQTRLKKKRLEQREDANIPEELKAGLKDTAKYGENPHIFLSTKEAELWQEMYEGYLAQHPELKSVNGKTELMALCDLQIQLERMRFKLLKGDKDNLQSPEQMAQVTKQLADFKKALGIHPEQLAKRVDKDATASIGAAVAKLQGHPKWREIRLQYYAEMLIQAVQMTTQLKADGSGYQIDEIQFFAMTRCRLVRCPSCGIEIVGGFRVAEVLQYLVEEGHLVPMPPNADGTPHVVIDADLTTVVPIQVEE
jgi:hypothetical protein